MVKTVSKPSVSKKEKEYREQNFPEIKKVIDRNLLCTACNSSVKPQLLSGKVRVHPFLDTLLCEKCFVFFGDGDFSVDEDGSDKYCRWCGQGGTLYLCSKCTGGFCKKCIKRNLPRAVWKDMEDDDWECLCCNTTPLHELRAICWAAQEYIKTNFKDKSEQASKKRKSTRESGEDDSDNSSSKNNVKKSKKEIPSKSKKKSNKSGDSSEEDVPQEEKATKDKKNQEAKQFKVARAKLSTIVQDVIKMSDVTKVKTADFKRRRVTAHKIHDLKTFTSASQSLRTMLESVEDMTRKLRLKLEEFSTKFEETLNEMGKEENGFAIDNKESTSDEPDRTDVTEDQESKKDEEKDDSSQMETQAEDDDPKLDKSDEGDVSLNPSLNEDGPTEKEDE